MQTPIHQPPRYVQLAQTLASEIEGGTYALGSLIPTEHELCAQFGASRFTVREAMKRLVALGMISRQAGVGTRVIGLRPQAGYQQNLQGLGDISRYTAETTMDVFSRRRVDVAGPLADLLDAQKGEKWLLVEALRRDKRGTVFAYTRVYIHPAFRGLTGLDRDDHLPIYIRIQQQFGEEVAEVRQEITGISINAEAARLLKVRRGAAGLQIARTYVNTRGEIFEHAINVHPAERFSYAQTFRKHETGRE